jgi:hypothetical protein
MPPTASSLTTLLQNIYKRPRLTIPTVSILFILVALVGLGPVLQGNNPEENEEVIALQDLVGSSVRETRRSQSVRKTIYLTWLSSVTIDITGSPPNEKGEPDVQTKMGSPEIRPDRFALLVASWVLAMLLLAAGPALVAADVVQLKPTREEVLQGQCERSAHRIARKWLQLGRAA